MTIVAVSYIDRDQDLSLQVSSELEFETLGLETTSLQKPPRTKPSRQKTPDKTRQNLYRGLLSGFFVLGLPKSGGPRCVTKCDRGRGSKLAKNSMTYFMDSPLENENFWHLVNFLPCMLRGEFAAKLETTIGYLIICGITNIYKNLNYKPLGEVIT